MHPEMISKLIKIPEKTAMKGIPERILKNIKIMDIIIQIKTAEINRNKKNHINKSKNEAKIFKSVFPVKYHIQNSHLYKIKKMICKTKKEEQQKKSTHPKMPELIANFNQIPKFGGNSCSIQKNIIFFICIYCFLSFFREADPLNECPTRRLNQAISIL
jgi:methyl coenzyme M reductase subunit D